MTYTHLLHHYIHILLRETNINMLDMVRVNGLIARNQRHCSETENE